MEEIKAPTTPTVPKYWKHDVNKCQAKFKTYFLDNMNNLPSLKQTITSLALNAELQQELIRPHSWKIFLKTLSFGDNISLKTWLNETLQNRESFKQKLTKAKIEFDQTEANKDSKFSNFEETSSIKHLIEIDVERTYGDIKLFQDEYIRRMEEDILYVFAQENKPTSYKQGMNENLAIFIHSLYPFYVTSPEKNYMPEKFDLWCSDPEKYLNQIYCFFHDEDEFASDLFYLLYNIMGMGLNKFYDDSIDPESDKNDQKTYLLLRCDYILDKLRRYNNTLYKHFVEIGLNAEIILQRWLKCVFSREFIPDDCIYIWDNVLANEFNIPSKNLEYIDYFCVAMFDYISKNLLTHDQNECFICLFKYPPFQTIDILVKLSEKIKENILKLDKPSQSFFSLSNLKNIKNKMTSKINTTLNNRLNDISSMFNNNDNEQEQRNADVLAELKKINDNKTRIAQLKKILNKYRNKFNSDDKMQIDLLLNSLEKNV